MRVEPFVSRLTINRLVTYYQELKRLRQEDIQVISSEKLGVRTGLSPEQIRKDLAEFGCFGKKGMGYSVGSLLWNIANILGVHREWNVAILGFGHLGRALANYRNFAAVGVKLSAIFDNDSAKVGKGFKGIPISNIDNLEEVIKEQEIHIGVITLPAVDAQSTADRMIKAGVRAIWNFAPVRLKVPRNITLIAEDLAVSAGSISYYLSQAESRS